MPLRVCTGFEIGTTAGWTTGNAGNKFADTISATPTVVTTAPRTGTYHLRINAAGAGQNIRWTTDTLGTSQNRIAGGFAIRFPTTVPTTAISVQVITAAGLTPIFFVDGSDVLNAGFEGGNSQAGPTLSANTWYYVEFHIDLSANPHVFDWRVDGTARTQVTQAQAATTVSEFLLGTTNSETWDAYYDDLFLWTDTADIAGYPFGAHKVRVLNVDTGGTWVLSGTAANWSTFTANGTLDSTFTVTEARDRTDEWPPTIGASADGFVQDAIAASDHLDSPMTSYTLAGGESVAGLRALVCGWAASTTATNIRFDAFNGTSSETFFALGDPNFDNSTTTPAWVCKMLTTANYDTQGELDAIELRAGWGDDANPDCGVHAWAIELLIKEATPSVTVTPSPIALVASLPQAGVGVGAAPAVVAGTATLPQAGVGVGVTKVPVAAISTLPQTAVGVGAAPAVVAATSTFPLATAGQIGTPATVTPDPIAAVAALPQAGVGIGAAPATIQAFVEISEGLGVDVGATPATIAAVATFPQATPDGGAGNATRTPDPIAAVASFPQEAISVGAAPATIVIGGNLPFAAVSVGTAPAPIAAVASLPQAAVSIGVAPATLAAIVAMAKANVAVGVTPATLAALAAFPQATPDTGGANASVSPATIVATTSFPQELVSVGVTPSPVMLVLSLPQPGVGVGARPAVLAATTTLPLSTIAVHGVPQPATIAASASFPKANVAVGVVPATIALVVVVVAPETVGELALNINTPGPRMVGAVVVQAAAIVGAATRAGGMPGDIS